MVLLCLEDDWGGEYSLREEMRKSGFGRQEVRVMKLDRLEVLRLWTSVPSRAGSIWWYGLYGRLRLRGGDNDEEMIMIEWVEWSGREQRNRVVSSRSGCTLKLIMKEGEKWASDAPDTDGQQYPPRMSVGTRVNNKRGLSVGAGETTTEKVRADSREFELDKNKCRDRCAARSTRFCEITLTL